MDIKLLDIPDIRLITPRRFGDHRGFFEETYNHDSFVNHGIETVFVQDNHSLSRSAGTVRGLHFQAPPRAQAKLVRCGRGRFFDVAVDIRRGSPTFGLWVGAELSFENGRMLLVPAGFAHGFMTLEPETEIVYKCSDTYAPETEGALRWDDPDIGINWPLDMAESKISDKDKAAPFLRDIESPFTIEDG
ncbi:dTDP-4-dehydrorhamnose 3,5-epimerase [Ruegeria conchae]|uniref:dTDP-4-dehydrorhamnose 3,5-epimerase n=1 Tax=Ruegeria conchae TaxID=981384 RepID=A0A497ZNI0_9RHOB|nr:dTDP-4-dehydrorhamnose 3,5-epimerase [Ruegeria conchae]RLK07364.1 dTDP-4-dehydrorhamnose 3,5-epimerase [Ruegeria conchae]UWR05141.1 dTDP-4-dehydrorhamnose 3,5-epimerase [Ruegeria conchae]